jgi:hypothetical protein
MPTFLEAKAIVRNNLLNIAPESSSHDSWIRRRLAALDFLTTENDLTPSNASTQTFDPVAAVSDMILEVMVH